MDDWYEYCAWVEDVIGELLQALLGWLGEPRAEVRR